MRRIRKGYPKPNLARKTLSSPVIKFVVNLSRFFVSFSFRSDRLYLWLRIANLPLLRLSEIQDPFFSFASASSGKRPQFGALILACMPHESYHSEDNFAATFFAVSATVRLDIQKTFSALRHLFAPIFPRVYGEGSRESKA